MRLAAASARPLLACSSRSAQTLTRSACRPSSLSVASKAVNPIHRASTMASSKRGSASKLHASYGGDGYTPEGGEFKSLEGIKVAFQIAGALQTWGLQTWKYTVCMPNSGCSFWHILHSDSKAYLQVWLTSTQAQVQLTELWKEDERCVLVFARSMG